MSQVAPTAQSNVITRPGGVSSTIPVTGGNVQPTIMTPTIPVEVPSHQETKETFHEVPSYFKEMSKKYGQIQGGLQVLVVVVLDGDHLVHVPMSLRARTSALDLWLILKRSGKVYGDLMTGYSGMGELHQSVVCSGFLLVILVVTSFSE